MVDVRIINDKNIRAEIVVRRQGRNVSINGWIGFDIVSHKKVCPPNMLDKILRRTYDDKVDAAICKVNLDVVKCMDVEKMLGRCEI